MYQQCHRDRHKLGQHNCWGETYSQRKWFAPLSAWIRSHQSPGAQAQHQTPCLEAKMTPFIHHSMKHSGGRKDKGLPVQLWPFKDKSSSGWLFLWFPFLLNTPRQNATPTPKKKCATSTFINFINLQTPGQVYHSLFCTSKQSSIQKHAKSVMVQKEPAKFKKLASIKTIPIFLGRGFLSCVCWHFQRPCTWVKHTETTWQGHNKTGAKYYLIQILRGKKWSWGEVTVRGGLFYFVEKYIFDWIQHINKMKIGPLAREERKQKFGNTWHN